MAQIITFGNFKGGVGKTANSTMASYRLANQGKKTLLVDLDPQGNATNIFLKTKYNFGNDIDTFEKSLMTCIKEQNLDDAIINILPNLDLMASAPDFALYPRYMEQVTDYTARVKYLAKMLEPIKERYDYIIIDVPPTISLITDSALYASDYCIIVMQTHEHSLVGARAFLDYIQEEIVDTYHAPNLYVLGIIAVLMQAGAPVDEATVANAELEFGKENIFDTMIHSMQRLKRYGLTGITEGTMHDNRVNEVYDNLIEEMEKRIEVIENGE